MFKKVIEFFKRLFNGSKKQSTIENNKNNQEVQPKIYATKNLLTRTEKQFYNAIVEATPKKYIVFPQIPLASIIVRTDEHHYQNELYRIADFGIFEKETYKPIALIEINDKTHDSKQRHARDIKVKNILEHAGVPLITFWVQYGVNKEYIEKRIAEHCK